MPDPDVPSKVQSDVGGMPAMQMPEPPGQALAEIEAPEEVESHDMYGPHDKPNPSMDFSRFEDFFPPLSLDEDQEDEICTWLDSNLKKCLKYNKEMSSLWGLYRAVYMLEYTEKFYPVQGVSANFTSGLLCDKMLEGMDRLSRAVMSPRPLFVVDDEVSRVDDPEVMHRSEWYLHSKMVKDLKIEDVVDPLGFFEFLLDGSLILEAVRMYESIPERTIETFLSADTLIAAEDRILDKSRLEEYLQQIVDTGRARVLVEKEIITKNGLQLIHVNKSDHLVPPGVYNDDEVFFRGRRKYYTAANLELLGSDSANEWFDPDKVEKVLRHRQMRKISKMAKDKSDESAKEEVNLTYNDDLAYRWWEDNENLTAGADAHPYKDVWAVYRVSAKYGYSTPNDPYGVIPKWCDFYYEPESRTILRATTLPRFFEMKDWFHFKCGHAPSSYYGFGFGARLMREDFLESNAVDLYLDAAALDTFRPFLCVHPDYGGVIPFADGFGPNKKGFVRNPADFKQIDPVRISDALLRHLLPLTQSRASNRTSVTPASQGQIESGDPRSPAAKTQMLLYQSQIGIESMIKQWNRTGWNKLATFVWKSMYENAIYEGEDALDAEIVIPAYLADPNNPDSNVVTLDELAKDLVWLGQGSSDFINTELRKQNFLELTSLFMEQYQIMAQFDPMLFKKYYARWNWAMAQELGFRRFKYLVPTPEEVMGMPDQAVQAMAQKMNDRVVASQSPGTVDVQQPSEQPLR